MADFSVRIQIVIIYKSYIANKNVIKIHIFFYALFVISIILKQ